MHYLRTPLMTWKTGFCLIKPLKGRSVQACPFRKFHPVGIRAVRQNHRIIRVDAFEGAKLFLARQRGGRCRKGGIRAAARALGLTRHRLGSHHRGLYKGCYGEHTYCSHSTMRNHGTVQTQTSTTPHDQSGTQGTRHSGTGAGHHADHQAADEDQTAVRTLR